MIYRYLAYGLKINSEIEFNEFLEMNNIEDYNYDLNISYGIMDKDIKELISIGRKVFISKENIWFYIPNVATYYIENGNKIIIEKCDGAELKDIKSYIVGTCMGYVLYQKGILSIHGGALKLGDKAIIIVGESGAGKSTLTTALRLQGLGFLTDDLTAIYRDEYPMVNPGYPGQRLCEDGMVKFGYDKNKYVRIELDNKIKYTVPVWESFIKEKTPLDAIYEIAVGDVDDVTIDEVNGSKKVDLLLRNIYGLNSVKHLGVDKFYFKECITFVKSIKMYKITRPRDGFTVNEQIKLIKENISF